MGLVGAGRADDGLGGVAVVDREGEGRGRQGEDSRRQEGEVVGRDVGGGRLPPAWAEPTPISTVERTATPVRCRPGASC